MDKAEYNALVRSVPPENLFECDEKDFTPEILSQVMSKVRGHGNRLYIGAAVWNYMVCNKQFQYFIDPVCNHEKLLAGELGVIIGVQMYTDAYNYLADEYIGRNDLFFVSDSGTAFLRLVERYDPGLRILSTPL